MMRKSPLLEEAWRYWTSLREGADLPHRSALDPKEMKTILGHSMILDRVRHGTVRVRLGGRVMQQIMGMEVRGLPMRAFFDLQDRGRAVALIEKVFDGPCSLELDLISQTDAGLVTGRMLVLPLRDAVGAVTKAMVVFVTDRPVTDAPRRFGVTNSTLVALPTGSAAPVYSDRAPVPAPRTRIDVPEDMPIGGPPPSLPVEMMVDGMAEEQSSFESKPSSVPWLRVVK